MFPFDRATVQALIDAQKVVVPKASIREMNQLVNTLEATFETPFIRMEFGIPGLKVAEVGRRADAQSILDGDVAHRYAPFEGIPELKRAGSQFAKAFMDLDIPPHCVVPTVGSMHGCYIAMGLVGQCHPDRPNILFLDPGFPVNKLQAKSWELGIISLDLKDFRGDALANEVDRLCQTHAIGGCLWSSPNNPSWVVLTDAELAALAKVFSKHQVLAIEDMAYFGMDFRQDYSVPYQPPFQPTLAHHTDQVFIIFSSSKLFSYAGQRCGLTLIPPNFAQQEFPALKDRFYKSKVLDAFIHGGIYPTTAGVPQGPQRGLTALLEATVNGEIHPFQEVREYEHRAHLMKQAFLDYGFYLVYDNDQGMPLADGFYFTFAYPDMTGAELVQELLHFGISAITLDVTGSHYTQGLRACVSLTDSSQIETLRHRLACFQQTHPR